MPRHNSKYWVEKFARSRRRDAKVNRELATSDWRVMRLWEHLPITAAADIVAAALSNTHQIGEGPSGRRISPDSIVLKGRPA
jgi:G:T-mismatch repair DNA endonuclease (very short patch repair protein)